MAYGTKYRATAKDRLGRTVQVDFQLDGHAGGVTTVRLAKDGLKRRWGSGKGQPFGLKPQLRSYRLSARDAAAAEEIATTGAWRTREFVGGTLFGQWEVIREEAERGLSIIPTYGEVAARCGLGALSEQLVATTFDEAKALLDAGPQSLLWWLFTALSKTGHQLDVETAIERTVAGATVPLEEVYARPERWVKITYNEDTEAESDDERYEVEALTWDDVASDVASVVGGVLAQHGGRWRLAERSAFYSGTLEARFYDHDAHLTAAEPQTGDLPLVYEAAPRTLLGSGRALERSGRPEVHVTYDPGETASMFAPDAFPPNDWTLNLGVGPILPEPGTVLRGAGGEYYVGLVSLLNDVPEVPVISSPAVPVAAGDLLGIGFTAKAAPNTKGDRSYTLFWRMLLDDGAGGLHVLREKSNSQPLAARELEWHEVETEDIHLVNTVPAQLTNNVDVRIEREIPALPNGGTLRWDLVVILDTNGEVVPVGFTYEKVAFVKDIVMLPVGGSVRTYAARLDGADPLPGEADDPFVMRLGRGPSVQHPGCLLTVSGAMAGDWTVGSYDAWPLAEHEARFRLEQVRNGQAERRCAYRLTPASPVLCLEDADTGEVFQWTEGEADDLRVSIEGTAVEVRVDSLVVASVPIKVQKQGTFGGGLGDVAATLARVIESQDAQLARIAQQNAVATTTEWETGELTLLWCTTIERPQEVLRKGGRVLVVDRRTGIPYTFTLAERQGANADYLEIEPYDLGDAYLSPDSGIYPVTTDLLNVQTYTAEATYNVIKADALCELAADTSGTVTSLAVTPLREAIEDGVQLSVQRLRRPGLDLPAAFGQDAGTTVDFYTDGAHEKNATTLNIRASAAPESGGLVLDAAEDAPIRVTGVQRQTEHIQTAYELTQLATRLEIAGGTLCQLDEDVAAGTVTSLPITNAITEVLQAGETITVEDGEGEPVEFVVASTTATLDTIASIAVVSKVTTRLLAAGARIYLSARALISAIRQNAQAITLRVEKGQVLSEMNVEFDKITFDTYRVCSENWDGAVTVGAGGLATITTPGTVGWCITNSGDAEFNDIHLRGEMVSTGYVPDTSGALFSDGGVDVWFGGKHAQFSALGGAWEEGGNSVEVSPDGVIADGTGGNASLNRFGLIVTDGGSETTTINSEGVFVGVHEVWHDGNPATPKHTTDDYLPTDPLSAAYAVTQQGSTHFATTSDQGDYGLYIRTPDGWFGPFQQF